MQSRMLAIAVPIFLAASLLSACASPRQHADEMAATAAMEREQFSAGRFVLTAYSRITRADRALTIYIEGDGPAWFSRTQAADDPSPRRAIGLGLALADRAPNVVYLARPCQFTPMAENPHCSADYWTGKRFSEAVIAAMDQAVSRYADRAPGQGIALVGYSGGGAVAVLLAARRHDVLSLRTVAGNLDTEQVNKLHAVSAMPDSLNPIMVAQQLGGLPQVHFSGADDTVVPPVVSQRFARAVAGHCTLTRSIGQMRHESDWPKIWPALLAQTPQCRP